MAGREPVGLLDLNLWREICPLGDSEGVMHEGENRGENWGKPKTGPKTGTASICCDAAVFSDRKRLKTIIFMPC